MDLARWGWLSEEMGSVISRVWGFESIFYEWFQEERIGGRIRILLWFGSGFGLIELFGFYQRLIFSFF